MEPHLKVYIDKSILVNVTGSQEIFKEGPTQNDAQRRSSLIREALQNDFLRNVILECQQPDVDLINFPADHCLLMAKLVDSVTSEVGRAIVALTVLQLCIKTICPEQSIRLHKGGRATHNFSWQEGISMRSLDRNYITPVLREFDLLRLNVDGFMMTRSLAENYPYTKLYKAALRGARDEWIEIVELIENGSLNTELSLRYLIVALLNRTNRFLKLAEETLEKVRAYIDTKPTYQTVTKAIIEYVSNSSYSARVFEIAMHSLFQALDESKVLEGSLVPLSQMRSANKKHGNVADIEVATVSGSLEIVEAWDAKFGKPYLRDELEELNEKLKDHSETEIVGFVVDTTPDLSKDIIERKKEIEELHAVKIYLLSFEEWVSIQIDRVQEDKNTFAISWLSALVESICQRKRHVAPIDEPCDQWVKYLGDCAKEWVKSS